MRVDRLARTDPAKTMMVDDLDDLCFLNPLDRLIALVVIHENDLRRFGYNESITADETDNTPVFKNRIIAEIGLLHRSLDIREQIERLETDRIVVHDPTDRYALVDETCHGIGIIRC